MGMFLNIYVIINTQDQSLTSDPPNVCPEHHSPSACSALLLFIPSKHARDRASYDKCLSTLISKDHMDVGAFIPRIFNPVASTSLDISTRPSLAFRLSGSLSLITGQSL